MLELEGLKRDVTELTHLLYFAKRPTVKEIIQMDIDLLLAKIESLKDIVNTLKQIYHGQE